jgi:hypothetical protein
VPFPCNVDLLQIQFVAPRNLAYRDRELIDTCLNATDQANPYHGCGPLSFLFSFLFHSYPTNSTFLSAVCGVNTTILSCSLLWYFLKSLHSFHLSHIHSVCYTLCYIYRSTFQSSFSPREKSCSQTQPRPRRRCYSHVLSN